MRKILFFILVSILTLLLVGFFVVTKKFNKALFGTKSNLLSFQCESRPIHFEWTNDTFVDYFEKQTALLIPVKMDDLPFNFYMQFDTGSPYSYIYEKQLKSLQSFGLDLDEIEIEDQKYVKDIQFILGENYTKVSMIKIYPDYGQTFNEIDSTRNIIIGTIGSDMMINKVTTIDFKNQELHFDQNRPDWIKNKTDFTPFSFEGRRIMLPVTIDNKNYEFLYDSGCSAYGLITTKNRYNKYSDTKTSEIHYDAKSWENSLEIKSKLTDKQFKIGNTFLSLKRVSYVDMYTSLQPIITPFTRVGGWLGNQPFNDSKIVLDTKSNEFAIIKSEI